MYESRLDEKKREEEVAARGVAEVVEEAVVARARDRGLVDDVKIKLYVARQSWTSNEDTLPFP